MAIERSAPGKVILSGEHSVVYGYPAIAVPVCDLRSTTHIVANKNVDSLHIIAPDINKRFILSQTYKDNPLAMAVYLVLEKGNFDLPLGVMTVTSQLPLAAGMGSGASVTVSIIRALSAFLGCEFTNETISQLTFQVEQIYHGSPSGIDNTVITWEKPIYFKKGTPPDFCSIGAPILLVIASSGIQASTREAVKYVQARRAMKPRYFERLFENIGSLTDEACIAIASGNLHVLGEKLTANHRFLKQMGVSHPKLDAMVDAALQAGAIGAKLTGSGQGGNIIALVDEEHCDPVRNSLYQMGSQKVWQTTVASS